MPAIEEELHLTFHPDAASRARAVDVVSVHAPLHPKTYHLFGPGLTGSMRRGSYIVNTARADFVVRDAIVDALESVSVPDTLATTGTRSPQQPTTRGALCRTTR